MTCIKNYFRKFQNVIIIQIEHALLKSYFHTGEQAQKSNGEALAEGTRRVGLLIAGKGRERAVQNENTKK
jgi:hypothetical protein